LLYAGWQRSTLAHGASGRVSLFGVNIDGTDHALFAEQAGLPVKRMPCVTDRGEVVFVEHDFLASTGRRPVAGQLSSVSFRRPLHSYRSLTTTAGGFEYRDPAPWPAGQIIVARRALAADGTFELCTFDPRTQAVTGLLRSPEWDYLQPVAVRAVPEPDGRSSIVDEQHPHGSFYCMNVNLHDLPASDLPPGTVRRVRFLEGLAVDADPAGGQQLPASQAECRGATHHGLSALTQRRFLGEIDIQADGSFYVEVPANIPIQIQTLDEQGMALRTCGWIWTKNREPRGCIGCHEDGELTPENVLVDALKGRAMALTLPPTRRRTVDFRRDVLPIIEQKCVACHGADGAPPRLDGTAWDAGEQSGRAAEFNRAYVNLLAKAAEASAASPRFLYVDPGQARTSPLIWHVFGKNLARPWDGQLTQRPAHPITPRDDVPPLSDRDRRTLVEWIDMGALWDGIPDDD
jgi:hypothetical protein